MSFCTGLKEIGVQYIYVLPPVNAMKCCVCAKGFSDNSLGYTH
jgi:hypothetical protein